MYPMGWTLGSIQRSNTSGIFCSFFLFCKIVSLYLRKSTAAPQTRTGNGPTIVPLLTIQPCIKFTNSKHKDSNNEKHTILGVWCTITMLTACVIKLFDVCRCYLIAILKKTSMGMYIVRPLSPVLLF